MGFQISGVGYDPRQMSVLGGALRAAHAAADGGRAWSEILIEDALHPRCTLDGNAPSRRNPGSGRSVLRGRPANRPVWAVVTLSVGSKSFTSARRVTLRP
jgi:hypothetical protein